MYCWYREGRSYLSANWARSLLVDNLVLCIPLTIFYSFTLHERDWWARRLNSLLRYRKWAIYRNLVRMSEWKGSNYLKLKYAMSDCRLLLYYLYYCLHNWCLFTIGYWIMVPPPLLVLEHCPTLIFPYSSPITITSKDFITDNEFLQGLLFCILYSLHQTF